MQLITQPKKQHFYLRNGEPLFEVPNKSKPGTMRPSTLADARKLDGVPSVTTIQRIEAKEAVNTWEKNNLILAAMTFPDHEWSPRDGESMKDVAKRIVSEAENLRESAADFGSAIHALIELFVRTGEKTREPDLIPLMRPFYEWYAANVESYLATEKCVVGDDYAGTIDCVLIHKQHGLCIVDWKTQKIRNGRPTFYPQWVDQLAAYDNLCTDLPDARLLNVVIGSNGPLVEEKLWTVEESDEGLRAFEAAKTLWQIRNKWKPIFPRAA